MLRWTTGILLASTVPIAWWSLSRVRPIVLGDLVLRPDLVGTGVLVLGAVLAVAGLLTEDSARRRGAPPGGTRWCIRWPINIGKSTLLLVAVMSVVLALFGSSFTGVPRVLDPASDDGCRVVVVEGFSGGTIQVLPAGAIRPIPVGSYSSDDGYGPIFGGTFRLTWAGQTAHLTLEGEPNRAVWRADGQGPIDCGPG